MEKTIRFIYFTQKLEAHQLEKKREKEKVRQIERDFPSSGSIPKGHNDQVLVDPNVGAKIFFQVSHRGTGPEELE